MSTIHDPRKTWLATGSLLTVWWRMPVSETKIAPCLPALAVAHLPLCLWLGGEDCMQLASSSLVFAQSFLLWAGQAPHYIRAFCRKVLSVFYFFSLAIPEFLLLSHISSLRLSSGHSGPVLTLSMQPATPCPACTRWPWIWVSGLLLCWELWLGAYSVGFFVFCFCFCLSSRLRWPLRFQNSPQTHRWECVLLFGNFSSFMTPSPGWITVPNSLVSLFVFYICPTYFWREWADFLGAWCPLPAFRSCLVEVTQHSNDLFINIWGRKWSSWPIPPPSWDCPHECWILSQVFHSSLSLSSRGSLVLLHFCHVVASFVYLRLLIFLLEIWIPACAPSSSAFTWCILHLS